MRDWDLERGGYVALCHRDSYEFLCKSAFITDLVTFLQLFGKRRKELIDISIEQARAVCDSWNAVCSSAGLFS